MVLVGRRSHPKTLRALRVVVLARFPERKVSWYLLE